MNICQTWPDTWSITNRDVRVVIWLHQPERANTRRVWTLFGPGPLFRTTTHIDLDMIDMITEALKLIDTTVRELTDA